MQIIGFNFTKISGERFLNKLTPEIKKVLDFKFDDIEHEKSINFLKDSDVLKISFKHSLFYTPVDSKDKGKKKNEKKEAEISFEGNILISLSKKDLDEILLSWKKKQISNTLRIFLSNFILSKCTPKTLELQQELNLPSHLPLPRLNMKPDN